MVVHVDEVEHLPNWKEAEIVYGGLNKQKRKIMEASYITTENNANTPSGRLKLSKVTTKNNVNTASGRLKLSKVTTTIIRQRESRSTMDFPACLRDRASVPRGIYVSISRVFDNVDCHGINIIRFLLQRQFDIVQRENKRVQGKRKIIQTHSTSDRV
ncbi:uncharacterized protein LOC119576690 [Penaeus monodon]|uniref:uncharacterized protein LOC119576690 n=1 Tax=Penaeus monodon TaxID=6687 RepID=UPI0018A6F832|nr:uncharacterized protein LOC119576690 [Penaeus monodon]